MLLWRIIVFEIHNLGTNKVLELSQIVKIIITKTLISESCLQTHKKVE